MSWEASISMKHETGFKFWKVKRRKVASSRKFYGSWSIDIKRNGRKDSFMIHATTTGVNHFRSWAAVKQFFFMISLSAKFFKQDSRRKDGLEIIFGSLFILGFMTLLPVFPTAYAIEHNVSIFRFFNYGNRGITVVIVILAVQMYAADWLVILCWAFTILMHTNSTSDCLQKMHGSW
jgi:hypothetical protein